MGVLSQRVAPLSAPPRSVAVGLVPDLPAETRVDAEVGVNARDTVASDATSATVEGVQWRSLATRAPTPALQPTRQ